MGKIRRCKSQTGLALLVGIPAAIAAWELLGLKDFVMATLVTLQQAIAPPPQPVATASFSQRFN